MIHAHVLVAVKQTLVPPAVSMPWRGEHKRTRPLKQQLRRYRFVSGVQDVNDEIAPR